MERRQFLATAGATIASMSIAGCGTEESSGSADDEETTEESDETETPEATEAPADDTETPTATEADTETETSSDRDSEDGSDSSSSGYQVRISYDGSWSGTVGGEGSMRSVDGSGTETFDIEGEPFAISANAQKKDDGSGTLTIQIVEDGEVAKESTTSAEYGMAQVSLSTA